jgi:hypothetical protein
MEDDAEGDMSSDPQTQCKNDPLAHHVNQPRPDGEETTHFRRMKP